MRGLRVVMVTTFYPPYNFGGDGIGVQRLARAFARLGADVTVVHDLDAYALLASGPIPPTEPPDDRVRVVTLRSRLGVVSPALTYQAGHPTFHRGKLRRLLTQPAADVIVHNNVSLMGGPGVLALGSGIKLYVAHEHWLVCPTHVLWRHGREPCTGRECIRCTLRYHRPPQFWRYTNLLPRYARAVDAFIALSEFSRSKHAAFGFDRPMEVIPGFLPDDAAATPVTGTPLPDRPFVLFAGRLERIKGVQDVIPLFRDGSLGDLVIAGTGAYEGELRRLAAGAPAIRFIGRLSLADLRRFYAAALAVVVPSVGYETFGYVLVEALREGTPVIARRIGPFPELLAHGGGLLYTTPTELVRAVRSLRDDPGTRSRLGSEGRVAYETHWTEAAVVPRYLELIARIARTRGRPEVARAVEATAA